MVWMINNHHFIYHDEGENLKRVKKVRKGEKNRERDNKESNLKRDGKNRVKDIASERRQYEGKSIERTRACDGVPSMLFKCLINVIRREG